ncbi:hypothetical protein SNE40_011255 [Patella caerulea]|uniref:Mutator-like transposase domain-containing protein n=1 Tax=Patella caerulea TaxID=87958 RepID=A0AAN8JIE2_PATCE
MHLKTFQALNKKLHNAAKDAVNRNLQEVRVKVKDLYDSETFMQDTANDDAKNQNKFKTPLKPGDIGVMYDGTWQKRGKGLSHNGICNTMEVNTGYLLDYEVLSNFCQGCLQAPDEDSPSFEAWVEVHAPKCQKNTDSSAHNMETVGAEAIWGRSEQHDVPLRYRSFLSDGDSAAFLTVSKMKPYGEDDTINEDCANHVAKWLGTALRKVKGLPRGHSLKEHTIKKLTLYYRIAVSKNKGDVKKMHQAIWASYLHSASTDEAHNHKLCPPGEDSWCQFNQAIAKDEEPPPHKPRLSKPQAEAITDIYKRLSEQSLLSRCRQGKTQNPCESLNGRIWLLCPKTRYASLRSVQTAAAIAILWYNKGYTGFSDVLNELKIDIPKSLKKETVRADTKRIEAMQKKGTGEQRYKRDKRALTLALETDKRKKRRE